MSNTKTYQGGCHCGKVRFEAQADMTQVMACNCSICSKVGAVMSFVPAEAFKLLSGEDALTDYQFNKKHVHHVFCSTCGIHAHASGAGKDGKTTYMLNARCLDDVDVSALTPTHFDGKSL